MSQNTNYTLITGASAGIGKAMAEECAKRNQNLILVALPGSNLEEVASNLNEKYQVEVKHISLNLIQPHAPKYLYDWCCQKKLSINILINNAGLGNYSAFSHTNLEHYVKLIKLNTETVVSLTHFFLPKLKEHRNSYILNVGSFVSLMPVPYKSVYSATKSFVLTFSRALQSELKQFGIHVSCLCPGPTSTDTVLERSKSIGQREKDLMMMTPAFVAKEALDGLFENKGIIIPGWKNRAILMISKLVPFRLKSFVLHKIFGNGQDEQKNEVQDQKIKTASRCMPPLPGIRYYSSRELV